ncbi:MAG: hypothetical protein ACFFDT_34615 [Candidatus Hodarchaeota archaeon]
MADTEALWASNENTRVYRAAAGEIIKMKQVGRKKEHLDISVSKDGMTIADELIPLEEISDVTSQIFIAIHALYFVKISLMSGESVLVYHMKHEGSLSEKPQNLETYLLLVALSEAKNVKPPRFENPKTSGAWIIRLVLFWFGFTLVGIILRTPALFSLGAIPVIFSGVLLLSDGVKYRSYEGGRVLVWTGIVVLLLGFFLYILPSAFFSVT